MPEVKFGRKDEPSVTLYPSADLIAVRTHSRRSLLGGPVPAAAASELSDGALVMEFPEAGVEVYRVPPETRSVESRKLSLRAEPDVRFAGSVLVTDKSGDPTVYTENLYVRFVEDLSSDDCREILRDAGLTVKRELEFATNAFFASAPEGTGQRIFEIAQALLERDDVVYCHPEVLMPRRAKVIAAQQWHLQTTTHGGVTIAASANVAAAHAITQGENIVIAVIDDGVDIDHPEFNLPGKVVSPRDSVSGNDDPRPRLSSDRHGTACAGVACASGQSQASGVAPKARLMPIRLAAGLGSIQEAEAFRWAADKGADVISCSWGPPDGAWYDSSDPSHTQMWSLPASTRDAIDYATTNGRSGKGCVIFFAAGNGNESVQFDGYASYPGVIAVAACNDRSKRSVYSDFGDAVWCSFPSNDMAWPAQNRPAPLTPGIWTTDRVGSRGYNPGSSGAGDPQGNYTNSFGGTSSACPGAAGVAALVLAVNPALRWQDVRDVIRRACDVIDPQGGAYSSAGRSALYGYGRLNAATAVQLARTPESTNRINVTRTYNRALPDLATTEVALLVGEPAPVESVFVKVDIAHSYVGDLVITLIPPTALGLPSVILHNRAGGAAQRLRQTYDALSVPALAAFRHRTAQGTWVLQVADRAARDVGTLVSFGLELVLGTPTNRVAMPEEGNGDPPVRRSRPARAIRRSAGV